MGPNDADKMTNSKDPDQTAPRNEFVGAVWSGPLLFIQSKN